MGIITDVAKRAFDSGGGLHLARWLRRNSLRILMYHRFSSEGTLRRQCEHLRRHYSPVSLSGCAARLAGHAPFPPCAATVTIDDGYNDFHRVAWPVFREYNIPVTVFLVTDFLDGRLWIWGDRIRYVFAHTPLREADVDLPGGATLRLPLDSPHNRARAMDQVKEAAKSMPEAGRLALLDQLPRTLRVDLPEHPPEPYAPLSWDQVREMAASGVEFGAHTRTHPILSRVSDNRQLREEIEGSRRRIQVELQHDIPHFCYPNGRVCDFHPETVEAVRAAGFRTAVTTEAGLNGPGADPYRLRRIGAGPDLAVAHFQRRIALARS